MQTFENVFEFLGEYFSQEKMTEIPLLNVLNGALCPDVIDVLNQFSCVIAGGCVRDAVIGKPTISDVDLFF